MDIINSVTKSRNTLINTLSFEYDTSTVPVYTNNEIEELYKLESTKDNPYNLLGNACIACNFTVNHKYIPNHKLHVLYYNFPEIGKKSSKVTKTIIDKINTLYINGTFNNTDNVIIIIKENITDTINTIINSFNIKKNNDNIDISQFQQHMKENKYNLYEKHFKNIFIFNIKDLNFNILNHDLVPEHKIIRDKDLINDIIEKCDANLNQLPIISINDPVNKLFMGVPGDLYEITRVNPTCGEYKYYRICR